MFFSALCGTATACRNDRRHCFSRQNRRASVVGFQDIQGGANKKLIQGCQFMQISEDPINLQEILFKVDGEIPENGCDIWWWDNNLPGGGTGFVESQFNYWWYDESDESLADNDYCGEGPCWTDDGDLPTLIKKTFVAGEGFYAQPYGGLKNPKLFFPSPFVKK